MAALRRAVPLARPRGAWRWLGRRDKATFDVLAKSYDQPHKVARAVAAAGAVRAQPWYRPGGSLLDVGAGTGLLTLELAPDFREVTAFDPSSGMLDVLRDKAAAAGISVTATTGPRDELGKFDLIVSLLAFHHIKSPGAEAEALIASNLRPGGRLAIVDLVATPNIRSFHKPEETLGEHYEHDGFDKATVRSWFGGCADFDWAELPIRKPLAEGWPNAGEDGQYSFFIASGCVGT